MISKDACFNLGYIAKTRGFKGELSLFLDVDEPMDYVNLDRVLVELNDVLTPFFIKKITIRNNGFADVYLEDIDSRESASILTGKRVFLPLSELAELPEDQYYLHDLQGMQVIDKEQKPIGKVEEVVDYSANPLLRLLHLGNEVLIPINDQFILRVDKKAGTIEVDLPDGLLEINRQ